MTPDAELIAGRISSDTGLAFSGRLLSGGGDPAIELAPAGYAPTQTFTLRTTIRWRSIVARFEPGTFAADLVTAMGSADISGRANFAAVLEASSEDGAAVDFLVNRERKVPNETEVWDAPWTSVSIELRRGQLPLGVEGRDLDHAIIADWTGRLAAAVVSLLPLEGPDDDEIDPIGFSEGTAKFVQATRYERDRRNRAAALAIHGHACQACGVVLSDIYGEAAAGFIEVHHLTPVSQLGDNYILNPRTDLAPLCPNCHGVAHRRTPPFTIEELRKFVRPPPA